MELQMVGRRALIAGGSKGVGLACAHGLAAEGVDLALAARTVGPLKDATRELRNGYDIEITSHSCDLARPDHRQALAEVVGPVDIVVNCAGTIPAGDLASLDDQRWRDAWDLKLFGTINLCRLFLPRMLTRGSGVIINVFGAMAPSAGGEHLAAFTGSAALDSLTRALGSTSGADGVRVVGVGVPIESDPAAISAAAEAVADVVVFLASDRASMVSGTVLAVDGGASGR